MIKLEKKDLIYSLIMDADENRWNTTFVRKLSELLDEIESDDGPGALITSSTNPNSSRMALILTGYKILKIIQKVEAGMNLVKNLCI